MQKRRLYAQAFPHTELFSQEHRLPDCRSARHYREGGTL